MAEPHRNRGGEMAEKEYGEQRTLAGWVQMTHPTLPDNDPITVLEAAVPAKKSAGWFVVGDESLEVDAESEQGTDSSWELTEDED